MSDNFAAEEIESKLSLVVRKPQEGKTSICITTITNDTSKNIHIVLTMNTLSAGMQFFGRMQTDIGPKRIVVFNSKKQTAGECHHAKDISRVMSLINKENIKVIVCCAHEKRMRESLPDLFDIITDSVRFREQNIKFVIHIDEAHKYIPENLEHVRKFNNCPFVTDIIGYSATPDGIWQSSDSLFHKILVRDVEEELAIIRSPNYFGVNRCHFNIYDELDHHSLVMGSGIDTAIPELTFERSGMTSKHRRQWYDFRWYFDLGNELLLLSFVKFILPTLNLPSDSFSYNFVPSYTRKATHYKCMELILDQYPTANVIIMNGNGYQLFRLRSSTGKSCIITDGEEIKLNASHISCPVERKKEMDALLEPSYMIQKLIKDTPNCPTFVTGFTCVGMSVTLINQYIGNFDNVVMAHQHYSRDKLYQLCRFLFKYDSWTPENRDRIKTTQFHSLTKSVRDTCIEYEEHVERICTEFAGKTCSLNEINGEEPEEPSRTEQKKLDAARVTLANPGGKLWKKFKVYDGNDAEQWEKAREFYVDVRKNGRFTGTKIPKTSMPKLDGAGFYNCAFTGGSPERVALSKCSRIENEKWTSRFMLSEDQLAYARIFVGYDNIDDPTEYTILIKYAILEDNEINRKFVNDYKTNKKVEVDNDSDSV